MFCCDVVDVVPQGGLHGGVNDSEASGRENVQSCDLFVIKFLPTFLKLTPPPSNVSRFLFEWTSF